MDEEIQIESARILSMIGDEKLNIEIFSIAAKLLKSESWWVRLTAVTTLKYIKDEKSINLIRGMVKDPHDKVRNAAIEFLRVIEEKNKK